MEYTFLVLLLCGTCYMNNLERNLYGEYRWSGLRIKNINRDAKQEL
jgi:hypothetical protein